MTIKCQLLLNPIKNRFYRSGDFVRGTLKFKLNKATRFNFITVSLIGEATVITTDEDIYEKINLVLLQNNYISWMSRVLNEGEYKDTFEFPLPQNLPSSLKEKTFTIVYRIVADFSKTELFGDKEFATEIPFVGDLLPCSNEPFSFRLTKTLFSLQSNKTIQLKIEVEKTFLSPGETIKLGCFINNDTSVPVLGLKIKLIKRLTHMCSKYKNRKVSRKTDINKSIVKYPILNSNIVYFECAVPTFADLYSIQNCKVFKREYLLHVTAKLPFPHINTSAETPIVIGYR